MYTAVFFDRLCLALSMLCGEKVGERKKKLERGEMEGTPTSVSTPCQYNLGKITEREEDSLAHGFRVSANHGGEAVAKQVTVARELRKRASCGRRERVAFTVLFHLESLSWAGAAPIQSRTSASANPV